MNNKWILGLIAFCYLLSTSCSKRNPSSLPPATQNGANTFACRINGKIFTNGGSVFSGQKLTAEYRNFYTLPSSPDSPSRYVPGWQLFISGADLRDPCHITQINLRIDSIPTEAGQTYPLIGVGAGHASARHDRAACGADSVFHLDLTSAQHSGELTITRFDTENRIVSGLFNYNVVDTFGVSINVTEGRFDIKY